MNLFFKMCLFSLVWLVSNIDLGWEMFLKMVDLFLKIVNIFFRIMKKFLSIVYMFWVIVKGLIDCKRVDYLLRF